MAQTERGRDRRLSGYKISSDSGAIITGALVFCGISYLTLRDPTVAFGRAIGFSNLAIVLSVAFAAVFVSCVGLQYLIDRRRWNLKIAAMFFVLASLMSAALSDGALMFVESRFAFAESIMESRVEYHCAESFNPGSCVDQLTICPQCKKVFTIEQRKDLQARLTVFADKLDRDVEAAEKARSTSGPLSEATDNWRKRQQRTPASEE